MWYHQGTLRQAGTLPQRTGCGRTGAAQSDNVDRAPGRLLERMQRGREDMRFTLKTMMLWVGVAAGLLAVYVQFLAAYVPLWSLAIPCAILVAGACLSAWRFRRLAAVGFVGIAILSNTLYALASLYPDYMLTPALRIAWFMAFLPAIGALGTAWAKLATQVDATPRRSPWVSWASVLVLAMMPGITLATVWPLHLAFLVYRSSLESLADRVETGHSIVAPRWVGPFRLAASGFDPNSKTVGLFIDPNPGGRTGFVRFHSGVRETDHFSLLLGTDTNVELGTRWSYRQDD